jgi:hypothetical protein
MKYKIIKKNNSRLIFERGLNGNPDKTSVSKSEWYEARRKGRIFGFWHKVGHIADYDGQIIEHTAHTLEEIKDYVQKWHEVNYGNNYKCEIVEKIDL